jgi:hypothetical protein
MFQILFSEAGVKDFVFPRFLLIFVLLFLFSGVCFASIIVSTGFESAVLLAPGINLHRIGTSNCDIGCWI